MKSYCCVECGCHVDHVYKEYSKGNIRLSICNKCNQTVDKYVEYENILIFIDLLLHKPQAYRHVMYNHKPSFTKNHAWKFAFISTLLDMNMKAYLFDQHQLVYVNKEYYLQEIPSPLLLSLHLFTLSLIENISFYIMMYFLCHYYYPNVNVNGRNILWNNLFSTVVVSNFGKLFTILSIIWNYHWAIIPVIGGLVYTSNVVAVRIFLQQTTPNYIHDDWYVHLLVATAVLVGRIGVPILLYLLGNPMLFFTLI